MQYTHTVIITAGGTAELDSSGNWTPGSSTPVTVMGRFEVSSGNAFLTSVDGKQIAYTGILYLPGGTPDYVKLGMQIEVYQGLKLVAKGTAKMVSTGQFNQRVWL